MATQIKLRRDSAANWALEDPVLAEGEPGFDLTNNILKIGDGTTIWSLLPSIYDLGTDIVPSADNTYDLGTPTKQWRHVYTAGGSIYLDDIKLSNVGGKFVATKVVNPGEENEAEDPEDSDATSNITGGAVVERSISFPNGESGDTRGTIALTPDGNTYICTEDWTDAATALQGTFTAVTADIYNISQSGGSFNSAVLSIADEPEIYNILRYGSWTEGQLTVNAGSTWGGAQNVISSGYNDQDGTMSLLWIYRVEDPQEIPQGTSVTVVFTGSGTQPPIWKRLVDLVSGGEGSGLGKINWRSEGDLTIETLRPQGYTGDCDLNLYAADDVFITANGDEVSIQANTNVIIESDDGNHAWTFAEDGSLKLPSLNNTGYEPFYGLNGPTLKLGGENDPTEQIIITGPTPNQSNSNAQRIVIQGQKGFGGNSVAGEGGDVYIWGGVGGEYTAGSVTPGGGGDIKVRGGAGQFGGAGGYVKIEGGDSFYGPGGDGGYVEISAGDRVQGGNGDGGDVTIRAGRGLGTGNNGQIYLRTGQNLEHEWQFDNGGNLTLPLGGDILDSNGNSVLGGAQVDNNIWVQTFVSDAPTEDFPQIATSVEYDDNGNVIALFSHFQPNGEQPDSRYYSVGKYTADGTKIWTARFADGLNTDGWGLAVDNADGWIYIAGQTSGGDYTYAVSTLTKIDSGNGSVAWSKIYDFGFESSSAVVDVDSSGNPVMVGWADNADNEGYLTITKIDKTNGNVIWTRKLDGQTNEQAYGMAVGPTGEIVAVGTVDNLNYPEPYRTIVTLSATPASDPDWTTDILGATQGGLTYDVTFAGGVPTFSNIVDTDGNRYEGELLVTFNASQLGPTGSTNMEVRVGTTTGEDMSDRMVVVKYASDGTIAWQKAIQFDADYNCLGADADIDSNGNVYICGQFGIDGGGTGIALVKFDSTGVKQWSRRVTGDCLSAATSIVVGPDDKLYISGVNGDPIAETFTWVVAKYSLDGLVEWQRFIENTDSWTFAGGLFGPESGGSNLAVRQGYVALAGGFGAFDQQAYAAVLQISDTGNVFAVGPWSVTAANLSGTLNGTASDIGVVNADLTDSDNALTVSADSVTLGTEVSNFLVGTLYTAPGGNASLVNGAYSVSLGNTGTVTLPAGGTITEGYVTSNPTIQLTPASPDVASQKLVIKGGAIYNFTDNGININYSNNTAIVGDTLTFYISSNTYADQTLYWWIYPEGANISDPGSGTVVLSGSSGSFSFDLDSDDNEFTVRVSPEDNNYDPANVGVETGLINADAPTFDSEHHLHLTTGNLTETSIFLGTDDHNVRTTTDGGIEITTPNIDTTNVWQFGTDGSLTVPGDIRSEGNINIDINLSDSTLRRWQFGEDGVITLPNGMSIDSYGTSGVNAVVDIGGDNTRITIDNNGAPPGFSVTTNALMSGPTGTAHTWRFGPDGELSFPNDKIKAPISNNISIETEVPISDPPTTIVISGADFTAVNLTYTKDGANSIWYPAGYNPATDPYIEFINNRWEILNPGFDQAIYVNTGSLNEPLAQWDTNPPLGSVAPTGVYTYPNTYTHAWQFGTDGSLTFPDATVQTTALVQGEQIFTLDTGNIDYAPTAVDFNLLFVTSAIGYSETDPTSVTLPNGVPGQRLVIFNGYNLATLTVNPGPFGRDISSGVVAEFIYSGFDGLWIPLYGTNSPT